MQRFHEGEQVDRIQSMHTFTEKFRISGMLRGSGSSLNIRRLKVNPGLLTQDEPTDLSQLMEGAPGRWDLGLALSPGTVSGTLQLTALC